MRKPQARPSGNEESCNLSLPPVACAYRFVERIPLKKEEGQTSKKEFETKLPSLAGDENK